MPTTNVRDTKLYYDKAGDGVPVLLFIHGACGSAWNWEDQMDRLSPEFTCVAYDRRGHSRSELGTEDQSYRTHVDDAVALMDVLELESPVVIGNSAGGAITIDLLHRYPERVRGAVISEPALFAAIPGSKQQLAEAIGPGIQEALESDGPRATVDAFIDVVAPEFWSDLDDAGRDRFRENGDMLLAALQAEPVSVTAEDLDAIEHPALVIVGAISALPIHELSKEVARRMPNSRLVEIENCGHMPYLEKPQEFAREVVAFAREVVAVPSMQR